MVPLFRAVLVWAVVLGTILLPRVQPPAAAPAQPVVTHLSAYYQQSVVGTVRLQRIQSAEIAQAEAWSQEYDQGNHPPPPAYIAQIIHDAFSPLGGRALQWAVNVAYCESRYHPNSVNTESGASGLFQFLPSTWAFTPQHASSPFDPVANAHAAAWLYQRDGPSQWECQG